jgi:Zn-dependent metalloprotease
VSRWKGIAALACALALFGAPTSNVVHGSRSSAGVFRPSRHELLARLRPAVTNVRDGRVTFLASGESPFEDSGGRPVAAARAFLSDNARLFDIEDAHRDLTVDDVVNASRRTTVRFQQEVEGVPVLGGQLAVHLAGGGVTAVNGETTDVDAVAAPRVAAPSAARLAVAASAKAADLPREDLHAKSPSLWVYDPALVGPDSGWAPLTVWKVEVAAPEHAVADTVLIEAQRGATVARWSEIEQAIDRGICDAGGTYARVPCSAPFTRGEGGAPAGVADVDAAYDNTGAAASFFEGLGRNGIDGDGMPLRATVRYCAPDECPYENAYWSGDQFVYGEGWALADDVVAHELSHGVTDYTSGLFYYYQSGAINESLSDVFGELADLSNGLGDDRPEVRWLMGEDLPFGVLRDMRDPGRFGEPDRMTSSRYESDPGDYGGVHTNSGVGNKTAYLIVDGGTFNGQSVRGLGVTKAGHIYYELASSWLTSGSDYEDLYYALPAACRALLGSHAIGADDCDQVSKAVAATELNLQPVTGAAAPEAPVCPTGYTRRDVFFDDIEGDTRANWVSGGSRGYSAWYAPQQPYPGSFDPTYTKSGTHNLYGDDYLENNDSFLSVARAVKVPPNAYLRFDHAYGFESDGGNRFDGGVVELSVDGGRSWVDGGSLFDSSGYNGSITAPDNALAGRNAFVGTSHGYHSSRLSLATLAGQDVLFRFRLGTDASGFSYGWYVDDVRVYGCVASSSSPPPAPSPTASPTPASTSVPGPVIPTQVPPVPVPTIVTPPSPIATPSPVDVPAELDVVPPSNPSLSSFTHRPGEWSSDATIEVSLGEARDASGIDGYSWAWTRTEEEGADRVVDGDPSGPVVSPTLEDGAWYFHLRTLDGAGNWSAPVRLGPFWVDTDAPADTQFVAELPVFLRKTPATLSWSASTDEGSGLAGYMLESEAVSYDSGAMRPLRLGSEMDPTRLSAEVGSDPGFTYCYRIVATDVVGNKSTAAERCTAFPLDDSDLMASRQWRTVKKHGAYLDGKASRAVTSGAILRRPGIAQARRVALLVATCKVCGEVRVSWNGSALIAAGAKRGAISLRSRKPGTRLVAFPEFAELADGTVTIQTLSARPVTILGLGVSKV